MTATLAELRGSPAMRWVVAAGGAAFLLGTVLAAIGLFWLLEDHTPASPNPNPIAASTLQCGSAYSPGTSVATCEELVDEARSRGTAALRAGAALALVGLVALVAARGLSFMWPYLLILAGVVAGATFVWLLFLPLDCGQLYSGTEGGCSQATSVARTAYPLMVAGPVLVVAGCVGLFLRRPGAT